MPQKKSESEIAFERGHKYFEKKSYVAAERCFQKALKLDPNHTLNALKRIYALNALGRIYNKFKNTVDAKQCFRKVLELDPNHTHSWNVLGYIYKKEENYTEAKRCFQKALESNPNDSSARRNLKDTEENLNNVISNVKIYTQKLEKMLKLSDKIRLDVMQDVLELDRKLFNNIIFDWAENYGFRISGDYIILENADIDGFISSLDKQFALWQSQLKTK